MYFIPDTLWIGLLDLIRALNAQWQDKRFAMAVLDNMYPRGLGVAVLFCNKIALISFDVSLGGFNHGIDYKAVPGGRGAHSPSPSAVVRLLKLSPPSLHPNLLLATTDVSSLNHSIQQISNIHLPILIFICGYRSVYVKCTCNFCSSATAPPSQLFLFKK